MAGEDGLAVMSLGIAEKISALSFQNNSFFCTSGKYGFTKDDSELFEVRLCVTRCTNLSGSSHCSSDDRCTTLLQNISSTISTLLLCISFHSLCSN